MMARAEAVALSAEQLQAMLDKAAECGAKKALLAVGLHDDEAAGDVHDLRGLLDAFRTLKTTALQTLSRVVTTVLLAAIAAAVGVSIYNKN
jgi:predicted xylose isomerase-like sugar epimerase